MDVTGEIIHHETDMYGFYFDPMIVKNLECDLGSGWTSLSTSGMKCAGDDFSEWKDLNGTKQLLPFIGDLYVEPPYEGDEPAYDIRFNGYSGWDFYYNYDSLLVTVSTPTWTESIGRWAVWETEILKRETDMPGTKDNPCIFGRCAYKKAGESYFTQAIFDHDDAIGCSGIVGNPKEWDINANGDILEIWNEAPLSQLK